MSEENNATGGAARPVGKRQLSGASTTSSASYKAKRVVNVDDSSVRDDKPGGGPTSFVPEVVSEMGKVVWPTAKQMVQYTIAVFAFLFVLTALVWSIDTVASLGVDAVLNP